MIKQCDCELSSCDKTSSEYLVCYHGYISCYLLYYTIFYGGYNHDNGNKSFLHKFLCFSPCDKTFTVEILNVFLLAHPTFRHRVSLCHCVLSVHNSQVIIIFISFKALFQQNASSSIQLFATGRLLDITYMCYEFKTPLFPAQLLQAKQSDLSVTFIPQSVNRWRHNEYSWCLHPLHFVQASHTPVVKVRLVVWRSDLAGQGDRTGLVVLYGENLSKCFFLKMSLQRRYKHSQWWCWLDI